MKVSRFVSIGLAVTALLSLLWLVGGNAFARYRQRQVERAWVQSFGTLQNLLLRYPKTATNDTARRLEQLVKPLGLDLTPKAPEEDLAAKNRISEESPESATERGRKAASRYLTGQLEKPEDGIDAPPPEAGSFLSARASDLRSIEEELLASPPPAWDFQAASSWEVRPIPAAVFALNSLQSILLARALQESALDGAAAARRTLEASWRLNQNLRRIPDGVCQIVSLSIATRHVGVLRKIDVDGGSWRDRLREHDFKRSLLDTELLLTWPSAKRAQELEELESRSEKNALKRLSNWFLRPLGSLIWSAAADGMRKDYIEIRESAMVRDLPEKSLKRSTPSQILLSIRLPNVHSSFRRVDEFLLDVELTDKILRARQLRRENGGKWPTAVSGIEQTRLPRGRWVYSVSPEGTMRLVLNQEPFKDRGGFKLPFRFTSS